MKKYFPYDLQNPQPVSGEVHQIIGGRIRLDHIPVADTLTIVGFVAADSASHLQRHEFYCNYSADTYYRESNRIVYFAATNNGAQVICSYMACGSPVTADDMNEIKAFMENASESFADVVSEQKNLRNLFVNQAGEALKAIAEHEADPAAHEVIRNEIDNLDKNNTIAHGELRQLIKDTTRQLEGEISSAVVNHNFDVTSHPDIRNTLYKFDSDIAYSISHAKQLVDEHNEDLNAHEHIQSLIDSEALVRQREDNRLDEKISTRMIFAGASTTFPTDPTLGMFVIVDDVPYIFGGNDWIKLKGSGGYEEPTDKDLIAKIFGNRPHENYNALGKKDFLTYVFGDETPEEYSLGWTLTKDDFLNSIFEEA